MSPYDKFKNDVIALILVSIALGYTLHIAVSGVL